MKRVITTLAILLVVVVTGMSAGQDAELRPDVPAQIAADLKAITTALFDLLHHIGTKVVGIDQQHQCAHSRYDHH